jgi:hypothetical protein
LALFLALAPPASFCGGGNGEDRRSDFVSVFRWMQEIHRTCA